MSFDFAKLSSPMQGLVLVCVLSAVQAMADWALKVASLRASPFTSWQFGLGMVVYMALAFLWVPVLHHLKLAVLGAIYGVVTALLLAGLGMVVFGEKVSVREWVGIGCAIVSIVLLTR